MVLLVLVGVEVLPVLVGTEVLLDVDLLSVETDNEVLLSYCSLFI